MHGASAGARLLAEAVGTAFLLAAVVGSGVMAERLADGNGALALLCNTLATAAMLAVLIQVAGRISGAHFNPAVSFVFMLRGELSRSAFGAYAAAQIAGALCGVLLAHAMFELPLFMTSAHERTGLGQWLAEGVATFGLIVTILGTREARPGAVAYTVALYIAAAYWFTASTSFANPAVTLARGFTDTFAGIAPAGIPAFVAAELIGALLAAGSWALLAGSASGTPASDIRNVETNS